MSRPTKFTPETANKICEGIELGLTYELAAAYGGVSYETFRQWREKKPAFLAAVSEAEAAGAAVTMEHIRSATKDDWRAAAWIMEHRHGYAAKTDVNLSGEMTARVELVGIAAEDV